MNIYKIILIDFSLVIAVILFLFLLQGGKKNSSLLRSFKKDKLLKDTSVKLPGNDKLLELEKVAKNQGSGIKFDSIIGDWKFISVWNKDSNTEDAVFSSLLRIFCANIEFKKDISIEALPKFPVIASIRFGSFTIVFSGSGYLTGRQPLLSFFFNLIEFKSGSNILLSRSVKEPKEKEKSFFALVALDENGEWLSARGQRGAVVVWLKD